MPTNKYLLFSTALRKSSTISKSHWAKGQGLDKGLRTPSSWWMFRANLWHLSHFFTYSCASLCMFSHQYPWMRALWDKDLPLVWLSQIPSCNSSRSSSTASGCMHNKYDLEKERLYNFWSLDSQNRRAFLHTLLASDLFSGKTSSLRNSTIESIQLGPTLIWWMWITFFPTLVGLHKSCTRITRGKLCVEKVASVARESACVFLLLGICGKLKDSNLDCKCLT